MLSDETFEHWFSRPQAVMTATPGVYVMIPVCKVCGCAVGMTDDHEHLNRHIRWHSFGHVQTRPQT